MLPVIMVTRICMPHSVIETPRLYHTVIPPYKVKAGKGDYPTWSYTDDPADREYIDIMNLMNHVLIRVQA